MKIKKSDVDKIIKEEFKRMLQKKQLTSKLAQINESLAAMDAEDAQLNEVEAAGEEKVSSHAWTGEANGDVKYKPKFEKIGTHLKEDDEIEVGASEEETPMGEFEAKFAEIGKAIDAKLAAEMGGAPAAAPTDAEAGIEMSGDSDDDDFEEVEVSDDDTDDKDGEAEIEEYAELVGGKDAEQGMTADQAMQKESVEEPLEGESVAQMTDADTVNDNMEKDKHVKESKSNNGSLISEATTTTKNIFTEGVDAAKKAKLMEEFNRMKKFAGLSKDEE